MTVLDRRLVTFAIRQPRERLLTGPRDLLWMTIGRLLLRRPMLRLRLLGFGGY